MKKLIFILLTLLLVSPINAIYAKEKVISVVIDGVTQNFEAAPVNVNGSVMVPMRAIFEALQAKVNYENSTREITVKKGAKIIILTVDSTKVSINDTEYILNIAPQIIQDRTMVPLRFVSEALGADVVWDSTNNAVLINSTIKQSNTNSEEYIEDEKEILELFNKKIEAENNRDGRAYHALFYKPKETVEEMIQALNGYKVYFQNENFKDIVINGDEAKVSYTVLISQYEEYNGKSFEIVRLRNELEVYLAKISGQWLFVQFKFVKGEQIPLNLPEKLT